MELRFFKKMVRKHSVILSFVILIFSGDLCAGTELKTGGDAPVTPQLTRNRTFQPRLKELSSQNQNILKAEYLFIQGRILEAEKKERQALQHYERASQYVSSDAILVSLVSLAIRQKRYDEAFRYFDKISDPALLGIEILDELSTRCARLDDNLRVVKIYRAILNAIPINEAGPLRMLIHDRLGWAEYRAGHFDEALASLRIIHSMMKNPARYGIREEEFFLFKDSQEINLFLLLDICVTQKKGDEAEKFLKELELFFEEKFKNSGSDSKEWESERKNAQNHILFEKARVAYVKENAEQAFELAMKAYENGFSAEDPPFQLLENILKAQKRSDEIQNVLEQLLEKQPQNLLLRTRLGEEYIKKTANLTLGNSIREAAGKKAKEIFSALAVEFPASPYYPLRQIELAVLMNDASEFLKLADSCMTNPEFAASAGDLLKSLGFISIQELEKQELQKNTPKNQNSSQTPQTSSWEEQAASKKKETHSDSENAEPIKFIPPETFHQFANELLKEAEQQLLNTQTKGKTQLSFLPLNWRLTAFLAILAEQMNKIDLAMTFYSSAMNELKQVQPSEENLLAMRHTLLSLAFFLFENEKYEEAEPHFRLLERFFPEEMFLAAHTQILMTLGKTEEAGDKIQRLKRENPESIEFPLLEANWLQQGQKLKESGELLKYLLAEVENDYSAEFDRERVSAIRLSLANVEEQLGNLEAAEEQMRLILDEFPDDITAKNTLAYFWACAKTNLNLALRYSKETLEEEPENPMFQDTMGWICFQLGNFEKAKEFLLNAEKTLEDPVVFSHLGDVFLALNQKDEAEKYFQKALELFQKAQRKKESIILKDLKHVEDQLKILKNS